LDKLVKTIDLVYPYRSPNAEELDRTSLEEFLKKRCWSEDAMSILRYGARGAYTDLSETSLLAFLWYVKQSGGIRRIFETKDGAQDCNVQGGTGQISQLIAKELNQSTTTTTTTTGGGGEKSTMIVYTSCPVEVIDTSSSRVIKLRGLSFSIEASYVIVAIPPLQQLRLQFTPPLEQDRIQSLQRFVLGYLQKTFSYYNTPFWRDHGLTGQSIGDGDSVAQITYESINGDGTRPCIVGFLFSEGMEKFPTRDERQSALAQYYAKIFGHGMDVQKRNLWSIRKNVGQNNLGWVDA